MKKVFEIKDKRTINALLDTVEYGTLALSNQDKPYAVPVNFVRLGELVYFHGALSNKKMKLLAKNPNVSFSVVNSYAVIDSFFSSTEGLACPATQFFKSVSIDGVAKVIEARDMKAKVLEALMQKLQPKGGYTPLSDAVYEKALKSTAVVEIVPTSTRAKYKFGQHLTQERFERIVRHLEERNEPKDNETIEMMKAYKDAL